MKTNKWIYAIVIVSLGWVACDDDENPLTKPNLNETDETFVEVAARSSMAEIKFGELAATKATNVELKTFAQAMVTEHTTAKNELKELADDFAGIEWPNDLDEGHDAILDQLNDAEGYSFDSLYIKSQVTLHRAAVNAFQTATTNTTEVRVKAYATKYLPLLQENLQQANSLEAVIIAD